MGYEPRPPRDSKYPRKENREKQKHSEIKLSVAERQHHRYMEAQGRYDMKEHNNGNRR